MNTETDPETYLNKVRGAMFGTTSEVKDGVIAELRSHIMDKAASMGGQASLPQAVQSLDPPDVMGNRYRHIYGWAFFPWKLLVYLLAGVLGTMSMLQGVWFSPGDEGGGVCCFFLLVVLIWATAYLTGRKAAMIVATCGGVPMAVFGLIFVFLANMLADSGFAILGATGGDLFSVCLSIVILLAIGYLTGHTVQKYAGSPQVGQFVMTTPSPMAGPFPTTTQPMAQPMVQPPSATGFAMGAPTPDPMMGAGFAAPAPAAPAMDFGGAPPPPAAACPLCSTQVSPRPGEVSAQCPGCLANLRWDPASFTWST
jgi:hypothetical protein